MESAHMEQTKLSLSPSCRILVVSRDLAHGKELVSLIQPLTDTPLTHRSDDNLFVEWTIKNKYYAAPVHLLLHQPSKPPALPLWPPEEDEERVPALIFVFRKDEASKLLFNQGRVLRLRQQAFKDVFLSMREGYLAHDPEVALAVSLPSSGNDLARHSAQHMEEFFLEHNFEYIDAEDNGDAGSESEKLQYDRSGLPRVLEALNTIMWPSMVRTPHGGLRRAVPEPNIDDGLDDDTFNTSFATVSDTAPPHNLSLFDTSSSARSLAELNAWLDDDGSWISLPGDNQSLPSPNSAAASAHANVSGFDDDFSDFLSAPPVPAQEIGLPSPADIHATATRIFEPQGHERDMPDGFDLTSVLGNLEAMKTEISAITNTDERRKAAARVALGLAMGLGLDEDDEGELDEELLRELHQL